MFSIKRILIAMMFALVFAGMALFTVFAQAGTVSPPAETKSECASCHPDLQMQWENGPHGQAITDPVFVEEWNTQGNPSACLTCHVTGYDPTTATWKADGVTCEACHKDSNGLHSISPVKSPMSVDKTSNLCGSCHTDARFGWTEWEGSTHFKNGMTCTNCHDPHNASLKITVDLKDRTLKDASSLCISCHEEASMNFPYSKHSKQGVTCIDCHLEHLENTNKDIHNIADHSFKASLNTCNSCHQNQMHADGKSISTSASNDTSATVSTTDTTLGLEKSSLLPEPTPASPIGFAGLAALIGLAAGMVLAPWLERLYRHAMQKEDEVKHEGK